MHLAFGRLARRPETSECNDNPRGLRQFAGRVIAPGNPNTFNDVIHTSEQGCLSIPEV
jgi:hypothetical protein